MRLLRSNLRKEEVLSRMRDLVEVLYQEIPSGVGSKGKLRLSRTDHRQLLRKGARWAVEAGYGEPEDLDRIESGGMLEGADPDVISDKAYERGMAQQGTLGSGNHFLEIQYVEEIYDERVAQVFGLFKDQITIMIHTGSRGFGHQVCTDYIELMEKAVRKYGIELPDRELACAPFTTEEAQQYMGAMKAAANYAWANRQCITHWCREAVMRVMKASREALGLSVVYDVAHNIAKVETHRVDGREMELVVHRKGATRAFPPGHPELPEAYRQVGQPVLIPGDMGRASYVLVGTEQAMRETFGSTCHGAGRVLSRHQAIKVAKGRAIAKELEASGILVRSAGKKTLAEEISEAYKDISNVVEVVHRAGLSRKIAKMRPLGVIKG